MGTQRFNARVAAYNKACRDVLAFIKGRPSTTSFDVDEHFEFGKAKCDRIILTLRQKGFATELEFGERRGAGLRKRYVQQFHTEDSLDRLLPLDRDTAARHGYEMHGSPTAEQLAELKIARTSIRRDPLAIYLMGVGEAPSLRFRREHGRPAA